MSEHSPSPEPRWRTYPDAGFPLSDPSAASSGKLPVPAADAWPAKTPPANPALPGYSLDDPFTLAAGVNTLRKDGLWTVPPYLRLEGDVGTIRIDFQRAQAAAYLIDVEIIGGAGSITLIMPAGWAVNSDRLRGFSSHRSAVAASPAAGSPLLALHGHLGLGSLRIRHPKRRDKRRLARQLRLEQERLR